MSLAMPKLDPILKIMLDDLAAVLGNERVVFSALKPVTFVHAPNTLRPAARGGARAERDRWDRPDAHLIPVSADDLA